MNRRWAYPVRWRACVVWTWCSVCVLVLTSITLRYCLIYVLPHHQHSIRERRCPPEPVEGEECVSWRPLMVPHNTCGCVRRILAFHLSCREDMVRESWWSVGNNSTCSSDATLRGPQQLVVALAVPSITTELILHLNHTINTFNSMYKGWVLRVYTQHLAPHFTTTGLCSLVCANDNLDVCLGPHSPHTNLHHTAWRWSVVGDPLVSVWALRHFHGALLPRDAHALTQFINSDKCWHLMKDHPTHTQSALGSGLLAGKSSWGLAQLAHLRTRLQLAVSNTKKEDEAFKEILLPVLGNDVMTHDSQTCHTSIGTLPFPSRRTQGQWVGMPATLLKHLQDQNTNHKSTRDIKQSPPESSPDTRSSKMGREGGREVTAWSRLGVTEEEGVVNEANGIPPCPYSCRPPLHTDWNYC